MMRSYLKSRLAVRFVLALLLAFILSVTAAQAQEDATGEAIVPGLIDIPMLPDAADMLQVPGMTSYTTMSSLEDTLAFYQEQVTTLGGQADPPLLFEPSGALFGFTLNGQPHLLVLTFDMAGTIVDLYQLSDAEVLGVMSEVPDERGALSEPTEAASSASTACEPGTSSVPITPDATSVQDMGGVTLSYMTSMSPADVTTFYEEQLPALGGQVSSPMPATDFMAMLNVEQNNLSYSIMIAPVGTTTNVTISSLTMQATITACTTEAPAAAMTEVPSDTESTSSGGCPRGVLPLLPDATDIQELPSMGAITYTTAATVAETVAFYEEQFGALGAMSVPQMPATDLMASPMFMLENQPIVLAITATDGSTSVSISIMGSNPFRGSAPCAEGE